MPGYARLLALLAPLWGWPEPPVYEGALADFAELARSCSTFTHARFRVTVNVEGSRDRWGLVYEVRLRSDRTIVVDQLFGSRYRYFWHDADPSSGADDRVTKDGNRGDVKVLDEFPAEAVRALWAECRSGFAWTRWVAEAPGASGIETPPYGVTWARMAPPRTWVSESLALYLAVSPRTKRLVHIAWKRPEGPATWVRIDEGSWDAAGTEGMEDAEFTPHAPKEWRSPPREARPM